MLAAGLAILEVASSMLRRVLRCCDLKNAYSAIPLLCCGACGRNSVRMQGRQLSSETENKPLGEQ